MRLIDHEDELALERGSVLVCIPAVGPAAGSLASVRCVLEHSDASIPILVLGSQPLLAQLATGSDEPSAQDTWVGMVSDPSRPIEAINTAVRASSNADMALLMPGIRVAAGWLERLRAAALGDSTIASATPLCLGSGGVPLEIDGVSPAAPVERAGDISLDRLAQRVAARTSRARPKIATMGPGCVYICRPALELAGPLNESLALDDALADLAIRLSALGMVHVLADDVLIEGDFDRRPDEQNGGSVRRTASRIEETVSHDEQGPLRRAVSCARAAIRGLSVTIDGRALTATTGGTQTYIIGLVRALARSGDAKVRVLVPHDLSERASSALESGPDVELLTYADATRNPPLTDVVHRPQQVFTPADLALLRLVGERIVIGQQDLIAYHNTSYHPDIDAWRMYRRTTRLALGVADQTIFFSDHSRRDALAEDLLPEARAHLVGVGIDAAAPVDLPSSPPEGFETAMPFLLCLGADYAHKNRPFAIELVRALRALGWQGRLVLAGAHVPHGSSRADEQRLLAQHPELAEVVLDLGSVDEARKNWLYVHAQALVYPTLYEGFGLIPLEAARANLPCLFAAQASLSELAGPAATLIPWDPHASAAAVLSLLSPGSARDAHVETLHSLPKPTWSEIAHQLVTVYEHALTGPRPEAAPRVWQELDRENYIVQLDDDVARHKRISQEYQEAYHSLEERVSTGLPLIDRGGLLSPEQQRGLMRVAGHGRLGALALKPFGLLGALGGGDRD